MRHNQTVKEVLQAFKSRGEAGGAPFRAHSHTAPDLGISVSWKQGLAACCARYLSGSVQHCMGERHLPGSARNPGPDCQAEGRDPVLRDYNLY